MLSLSLQARIFQNYHSGQDCTNGRKYRYTVHRNPLAFGALVWIMRQPLRGGSWEWVQPLALNMQFTPRNSVR